MRREGPDASLHCRRHGNDRQSTGRGPAIARRRAGHPHEGRLESRRPRSDLRAFPVRPGRPDGPRRLVEWPSTAATPSSTSSATTSSPSAGRPEVKRKIRDSRVRSTDHLVAAVASRRRPSRRSSSRARPSATTVPTGDEELTESSPAGTDFMAVVCREWEDAARPVRDPGVRAADRPHRRRPGEGRGGPRRDDPGLQAGSPEAPPRSAAARTR